MALSPLLTPEKVEEVLGKDRKTLERWRSDGYGPRWLKVGRSIRYRESDLQEWLESRVVGALARHLTNQPAVVGDQPDHAGRRHSS